MNTDTKTTKPAGKPDAMPAKIAESVYSTGMTGNVARMLGSENVGFANGLLKQMMNAGTVGAVEDMEGTDFIVGVVLGIGPRDELEALLATQIAAVHLANLRQQRQLITADNILKSESAGRTMAKLSRTFMEQLDALERLRSRKVKPVELKTDVTVSAMEAVNRRRRIPPLTDAKTCLPAARIQSRATRQHRR